MASSYYWVDLPLTSVSAARDLLELTPNEGVTIRPVTLILGQRDDTFPTDDENLEIYWCRGNTTAGTGGTAVVPQPTAINDAAAPFTAVAFRSAAASGGTECKGPHHVMNIKVGLERPYTEQEALGSKSILTLRLPHSPAAAHKLVGSVLIEVVK